MNPSNQRTKIQRMILAALFAAIITLTTAYLMHIPVPMTGGYIHLGDAFIYLAACFLPTPYAVCAALVGGGLADLLSGAAVYILPTVIIKALMTVAFVSTANQILTRRNIFACVVGGGINIAGYLLADAAITGSMAVALTALPASLIQSGAGAGVFLLLGTVLDRWGAKGKMLRFR
jgi:uncharacterized repeat protein (TIGR04002 family)